MENSGGSETLDYLLEIEAQAAQMVQDASSEADKRIHDNDEKKRKEFDDRYKSEINAREIFLKDEVNRLKEQYRQALEDYRKEISVVNADTDRFAFLFNSYIEQKG